MPRIRPLPGTAGDGLRGFRAPGLYAWLLETESGSGSDDPRWRRTQAGQRGEAAPAHFRRSTHLLEALKAGKTVVVPLPSTKRWGLPWQRPDVTAVTVTVQDVVCPTDIEFAPPGRAVDLSDGSCMPNSREVR